MSEKRVTDRDLALANEPDPYVIATEQAQPYNTPDLKLTKGLTYVRDGKEIAVRSAIDTLSLIHI